MVEPDPTAEPELLFLSSISDEESVQYMTHTDIYRMSASGAGRTRLTQTTAGYGSITFAPDGKRFAFYGTQGGCPSVWSMNVDGTELCELTPFELRCNRTPRWSPDGKYIAFQPTTEGRYSIYVMNADGSEPRNVSRPLDQTATMVYVS